MNYIDIRKSEYYINTYSKIEEIKKDFPVNHGFVHINHVINYAKQLSRLYGLNNHEKKLLYIACSLHDIGYVNGREDHAKSGSIMAREYLGKSNLTLKDIDIICNAIANHGGKKKEDFLEPVSRCLAIADKMDFTRSRYDINNTQYNITTFKNIIKTELSINNNCYILNILVTPQFSEAEFNNDYFGKKLNNFLHLLSSTFNMEYKINFTVK